MTELRRIMKIHHINRRKAKAILHWKKKISRYWYRRFINLCVPDAFPEFHYKLSVFDKELISSGLVKDGDGNC